jgi:hypothetical protein
MAEEDAERLARIAERNIKKEDILHRGFLKPIEVALKTYQTERLNEEYPTKMTVGSLPAGLKIAVRTTVGGEKRILKDIEPILDEDDYENIKVGSKDNGLALMKRKQGNC